MRRKLSGVSTGRRALDPVVDRLQKACVQFLDVVAPSDEFRLRGPSASIVYRLASKHDLHRLLHPNAALSEDRVAVDVYVAHLPDRLDCPAEEVAHGARFLEKGESLTHRERRVQTRTRPLRRVRCHADRPSRVPIALGVKDRNRSTRPGRRILSCAPWTLCPRRGRLPNPRCCSGRYVEVPARCQGRGLSPSDTGMLSHDVRLEL